MKNELVLLPDEVKELAIKVPEQKQAEVQEILTQIFQGTNDWESKIDAIEVKDINDLMSIQMADAARRNVKVARLQGEKMFDAKRQDVQLRMADDKLEDSLWLKSKQIMQLKLKALEEKAAFKANFIKRHETEQRELKNKLRIEKVLKFNPDVNKFEIENLSDDMFDKVLAAYEKEYNDRIAAEKKAELERIEKERIYKLHESRKNSILNLWKYVDYNLENKNFGEYSDTAWGSIVKQLTEVDKKEKEKQAIIVAKNKQLEKEAKEKEAKAEQERKERELEAEKLRKENKAKLQNEREEREKEAEKSAIIQARLNAENQRIERDKQALIESERKEKQRLLDEEQKKIKAEKAAQLAPDKDKLINLARRIMSTEMPELKAKEANDIMLNVIDLLSKIDSYIKEKIENL